MSLLLSTGQGYHDTMKRLQAYQFSLGPDGEQARLMRRFCDSCRFVYNKALALQKERYDLRRSIVLSGTKPDCARHKRP